MVNIEPLATAALPKNFSGEPQKHSPPPDLLDPPHHAPPRAATAAKTTTTATTYNTTMAVAALAVIFATQPPQQHQKGAFDSYKDATGCVWFHKYQECVGFCRKSQIRVRLALGLAPGGVRLGGSHHHSVRLGGSHHLRLQCIDFGYNTTRVRSGFDKSTKGALVSRLPQMADQGRVGLAVITA
nr:hypothetical protein [Tanacetum cinerariifolium]